ncbi:glutamine synthetase family protein [Microbacterium sp. RD1]|uniref:glutamine synthetase family protein n=1 Tax=Microbacterium sp. RD1 TaxID=3457313 RepID=UPI003FA53B69
MDTMPNIDRDGAIGDVDIAPPAPAARAPRYGALTVAELMEQIDAGLVEGVLLITPDNTGRCLAERVAADGFIENLGRTTAYKVPLMLWGLDIEQDVRPGLDHIGGMGDGVPDVYLSPDLGTLRRVPWVPMPVVICDPVDENGVPLAFAPRQILKDQLTRLEALGVTLQAATEVEFYLFDESYESAWHDDYRTLTPSTRYHAAYDAFAGIKSEGFIAQVIRQMDQAGVEIEGYAGEYGLGQHEINLKHTTCLDMADRHFLYKWGVKTIAARMDKSVTFMAKWNIDSDGNSCHVHVSLWDQDGVTPLGADARFDGFVGGLAARAEAATLMYAPLVNSYRRFRPHSFAPTAIAVGDNNRTCSLRVVGSGDVRRIENRIPGADVNPYVALGAIALSGADGIEASLTMPPMELGDVYSRDDVPQIPGSLHAALDLFERSDELRAALGEAVHGHLLALGREEEKAFLNETVTDWEKRRLFERG